MQRNLFVLSVALWLLSLILPTLPSTKGPSILGYELIARASIMVLFIPWSLVFPLHIDRKSVV